MNTHNTPFLNVFEYKKKITHVSKGHGCSHPSALSKMVP